VVCLAREYRKNTTKTQILSKNGRYSVEKHYKNANFEQHDPVEG